MHVKKFGNILVLIVVLSLTIGAGWTTQAAFGPYVLYWVWLIATSILLMRRVEISTKI